MRWAMYMYFTVDRRRSLAMLELIAEKWPRRGAAAKLLAT